MKRLLINCFYEGMTVAAAVDFITRCYEETPTEKQIAAAKKTIKECNNVDWE